MECLEQVDRIQLTEKDYVLVAPGDTKKDWASFAIKVLDRHFGIGADSLLVFLPSRKADFRMRRNDLLMRSPGASRAWSVSIAVR